MTVRVLPSSFKAIIGTGGPALLTLSVKCTSQILARQQLGTGITITTITITTGTGVAAAMIRTGVAAAMNSTGVAAATIRTAAAAMIRTVAAATGAAAAMIRTGVAAATIRTGAAAAMMIAIIGIARNIRITTAGAINRATSIDGSQRALLITCKRHVA